VVRGVVHVGLDVTPVVGTAKGVLEIFTGDLIPDKPKKNKSRVMAVKRRPADVQ
jgi:hypothetical protein